MEALRTLLFVPGHKDRLLEKAPGSGADGLLYDLEDSVPPSEREIARHKIHEQLLQKQPLPCLVRINGLSDAGPKVAEADLEAVVVAGLTAVMLPKAQAANEITFIAGHLDRLERSAGLPSGQIEIALFIESALGVARTFEMAKASPRVTAIGIGSAEDGDLMNDLGCQWTPSGIELHYARSRVLLEARAAGIEYLIDGVFLGLDDEAGLVKDAEFARTLGYRGKTVIHPRQIAPVNRVFTPSEKEMAYYRAMIAAFETAEKAGTGAISFKGKMIDRAMVRKARDLVQRYPA
jgi:citrate lyase subunit beta/citryl-CoA lyase